jgi:nitrite reductase/ring-hydroxylating ferredoxin subunit
MTWRRLPDVPALPVGAAVFVEAWVRGERRDCVLVGTPGGPRGFLNVCAHRNQPVVVDGRPFDEEGRLECRAHGAKYDAETGLCVQGPCAGARLVPVPVELRDGACWVDDDDAVDDSAYEG